jgi:hypothetical protein
MQRISWLLLVLLALLGAPACSTGDHEPATPVVDPGDPAQLAPPPAGEGLQFGTGVIDVPPGTEVQDCFFFLVSDLEKAAGLDPTKALNLHRVEVAARPGSHHMTIFRVRTVVGLGPAGGAVQTGTDGMGQCFDSANWADWPLVVNSQEQGTVDWTYPDGVANVIQPDEWLMLQAHYVNAATQQTLDGGLVHVNFWTVPDADVTSELGTIFATNQSIRICESNPTPTFQSSCQVDSPSPVQIIGANGHFHSRGREFDMYLWDGKSITTPPVADRFYQSLDWSAPPMLHSPALDVAVQPMGGFWYSCSYQWVEPPPSIGCATLNAIDQKKYGTPTADLDCCYTFGPLVDENEHCNAFVYYYPKQDDVNCF